MKLINKQGGGDLLQLLENQHINYEDNSIKFFNCYDIYNSHYSWILLIKNNLIIGVIKTQKSMFATSEFPFVGINYVSVHNKYQDNGYASMMLDFLFRKHHNQFLFSTPFEKEGIKLKNKMIKLALEHNVYYLDREILSEYKEYPDKNKIKDILTKQLIK